MFINPEVSIIIPAYNTEKYIAKAIESALAQTLTNFEVIIVDDASTDHTIEVINQFNDDRIRLISNQKNLGAGGSRNIALRAAKGKWVAVLDSDDWYAPERLEKLLAVAYENNADMVADDLSFVKDGEEFPWSTMIRRSGEEINSIKEIDSVYFVNSDIEGKKGLGLGFSKPLFRRDFLLHHGIKYDAGVKVSQDFWLDMDCLIHGARFFLVPIPYYFYRIRQEGALTTGPKLERLEQECDKIRKFCIENEDHLNQNPDLLTALHNKLKSTKQHLSYYRVVEPLKKKKWIDAMVNIVANPYAFVHFVNQMPIILSRRIQFSVLGNKQIFDRMY